MAKPSLVILAAGMGSRYGGLKQMDSFGPSGETIVDYTVYDAIQAGFEKVVFVIRKDIEAPFKEKYIDNISRHADVHCVFQQLDSLPEGYAVPIGREKPWGTAHAVWMAESVVNEPFAMVNADDYYGRSSLKSAFDHLNEINNAEEAGLLVGYKLRNTLSEHGKVSRGICEVSEDGYLEKIVERTDIYKDGEAAYYLENDERHPLTADETVSMNLMGFSSKVFDNIAEGFDAFYKANIDNLKGEYYIPKVMDEMIKSGVKVPVLKTDDNWFGVTYQEDKPVVQEALSRLIEEGFYEKNLWN